MKDWKTYYRKELEAPEMPSRLRDVFQWAEEQESLVSLVKNGAILAFPHTSVDYSANPIARVVTTLIEANVNRVVALGVFHVWGHKNTEKTYALAMDDTASIRERALAFETLSGAFCPATEGLSTPFGELPLATIERDGFSAVQFDEDDLLAHEFSLDTFMAMARVYADLQGRRPLAICPVYIGITRDPMLRSFTVAQSVAQELERLVDTSTAIVATGDVVHYGTVYSPAEMVERLPKAGPELHNYLQTELEVTYDQFLKRREFESAFHKIDRELNNDQRYLLPVLANLLGPSTGYDILSFELSDYAGILKAEEPCFVASSLIAYRRD
jgi:hypothetical protein